MMEKSRHEKVEEEEENGVRQAKRYSALSRDQTRRFSSSSMTREVSLIEQCYLNSIVFLPSDPRFRKMSKMNQFLISYDECGNFNTTTMKLLI